jgi:hypothetical protein
MPEPIREPITETEAASTLAAWALSNRPEADEVCRLAASVILLHRKLAQLAQPTGATV